MPLGVAVTHKDGYSTMVLKPPYTKLKLIIEVKTEVLAAIEKDSGGRYGADTEVFPITKLNNLFNKAADAGKSIESVPYYSKYNPRYATGSVDGVVVTLSDAQGQKIAAITLDVETKMVHGSLYTYGRSGLAAQDSWLDLLGDDSYDILSEIHKSIADLRSKKTDVNPKDSISNIISKSVW